MGHALLRKRQDVAVSEAHIAFAAWVPSVTLEPKGYISRAKISWHRSPRRWQYHESLGRKDLTALSPCCSTSAKGFHAEVYDLDDASANVMVRSAVPAIVSV